MNKLLIYLLIIPLIITACTVEFEENDQTAENNEQPVEIKITDQKNVIEFSDWHEITAGLKIKEEIYKNNTNGGIEEKITLVKINPDKIKFEIAQDIDEPKTVNQWQQKTNALMVSNAGYFTEEFKSAGLLIIDGEAFGPKKSETYTGMLLIKDGYPQLRYLPVSEYDFDKEPIDFGVQSFPTLIKPKAETNINIDNEKISRRTIIAEDVDKNLYLIYTHNYNITLYQIMNYLLDSDIKFTFAFNLDGGSSTGLEIKHDDFAYSISSVSVPNVIILNKR